MNKLNFKILVKTRIQELDKGSIISKYCTNYNRHKRDLLHRIMLTNRLLHGSFFDLLII